MTHEREAVPADELRAMGSILRHAFKATEPPNQTPAPEPEQANKADDA